MQPAAQEPAPVPVLIHPSLFPAAVEDALVSALDAGRMGHRFHYESAKQARRWLRVHEAFSPAILDESAVHAYRDAASAAADMDGAAEVDVLSLGCGGGRKDAAILRELLRSDPSRPVRYIPSDVSVGLTLVARESGIAVGMKAEDCRPVALDLEGAEDWAGAFGEVLRPDARRIVAFFGMMPNFLPRRVLKRLADLIRTGDRLLVSANLSPGPDYVAGVRSILPLYDNAPTAEWLQTVLLDLGAERGDGRVEFGIQECPEGTGLLRIEADFLVDRPCVLAMAGREWRFEPGQRFGLFYSYRHTPERVAALLGEVGLAILGQWANTSGDEGVFLLGRTDASKNAP